MGGVRAAVCVAVVSSVVLLSACSADAPEPPPSSTAAPPSSSSSPSSSSETAPAPAPPPLPPEATTPDAAGAAAFVRHWFDLVNYAYATGDTTPIEEASDPGCETCSNTVQNIDSGYSAGGTLVGGTITVVGAEAPVPNTDAPVLVTAVYRQDALRSVDADGTSSEVSPPEEDQTIGFFLAWRAGSWRAVGIGEG